MAFVEFTIQPPSYRKTDNESRVVNTDFIRDARPVGNGEKALLILESFSHQESLLVLQPYEDVKDILIVVGSPSGPPMFIVKPDGTLGFVTDQAEDEPESLGVEQADGALGTPLPDEEDD